MAVTALILAWIYRSLAQWLVKDGTTPLVATVVSILAAGIGTIHFLTRPHLLTFAFVLWTLRVCRTYHEQGGWSIWTVPLIVALWGNLHGGFLAGPLIVATAGLGEAISGPWNATRRARIRTYVVVFLLSLFSPLLNPYGIGLYRHVGELLVGSGVTQLIDEYKPAPFGQGEARVLEWVVLGLIALPVFSRRRPSRYDLLQALVWLHLALTSIRHAPLFAMAVAPMLSQLLDGLLTPDPEGVATERQEPDWSLVPLVASLTLAVAVSCGVRLGGHDPKKWPLQAVPTLDRQPLEARLFHEQDWGGLIEALCRPTRQAYLDDRFELWGREPILEYVGALGGGPDWDTLQARQRFGLVWVKPDRGLAKRLRNDPQWQVVYQDSLSILFRHKPRAASGLAANQ